MTLTLTKLRRTDVRLRLCPWLLPLLLVSACGPRTAIVSLNPPQAIPPPVEERPQTPEATSAELPENVQIYRDEDGMFALALPEAYKHESGDRGMTFTSPDGGFGGEISYALIPEPLTPQQLEARLKQSLQESFVDVSWEKDSAEKQSDGSLRQSWRGVNSEGQQLDALSFIEQHSGAVYTLTAYGIGRPYGDYNKDAQIIAGSYVVRQTTPSTAE
ncbi:MAG: hypothetical protein ACFB4J_12205 [Elainellaceae cyanobacterium]